MTIKKRSDMAIAQMNWGRMRYPIDDARMTEFAAALDAVYRDAEAHPGFIWRIAEDESETQLRQLGYDAQTSATVSTWATVEDLKAFTFSGAHGAFLRRTHEWFEQVEGPQLVIWNVDRDEKPSFGDAFNRLAHLARFGNTSFGYGWPD